MVFYIKSLKSIFKFIIKLIFCFVFVGGLYLLIETLWDGTTSVEMYYLAGFVSIPALVLNNVFTYDTDFVLQCGICTIIATIGEGITGHICNMDYSIWDYRNLPLSFWDDQINIIFCLIWFVLFFIFIPFLDYIEWQLFGYKKEVIPYYKIFGKKRFDIKRIIDFLSN